MSSAQPDGIGYAEQEEAVRALSRHYTDGRLDVDEFDERVRRARSSTTGTELGAVFADLPRPHPSGSTASEDAAFARPEPGPWESGASSEQTVSTPRQPEGAGPQPAAGDGYGSDETARSPAAAPRYPDTAQYPGPRYPDQPYPGHQYPDQPYPGTQDPGVQYPGVQYPGSPYPCGYQYGAPPQYGNPQYAGEYPPPPGVPYGFAPGGYDPAAPYGRDPLSGRPYSDKQKIVAGLLQIFLPFGVGRFYTGDVGIGIAQLLVTFVTFGFGAIWSFIDGIVYLAGSPTDQHGRPLRP